MKQHITNKFLRVILKNTFKMGNRKLIIELFQKSETKNWGEKLKKLDNLKKVKKLNNVNFETFFRKLLKVIIINLT